MGGCLPTLAARLPKATAAELRELAGVGSLRWSSDLTFLELGSAPSVWMTLAIAELLCRGTCPEVLLCVRAQREARRLAAAAQKRLGSTCISSEDALQTASCVYHRFVVSVTRRRPGSCELRVYAPQRLAKTAQLFVGVGEGRLSVLTPCGSESHVARLRMLPAASVLEKANGRGARSVASLCT